MELKIYKCMHCGNTVSYTHLDVYKRQVRRSPPRPELRFDRSLSRSFVYRQDGSELSVLQLLFHYSGFHRKVKHIVRMDAEQGGIP